MSADNLLVEVSPPLLAAMDLPGDGGPVDFFALLGLDRSAFDGAGLDASVMARSRTIRQWQNSPQHGPEAVKLLPLFHRIASILKDSVRRAAYEQELDRALRGEREDPVVAFRDMVRAAMVGGAIDRASKAELTRYAEHNQIPMEEAGRIIKELAATMAPAPDAASAGDWEFRIVEDGGEKAFRESLALSLTRGQVTKATLDKVLQSASAFSLDSTTAARIVTEVFGGHFKKMVGEVAQGGVISNNQARLLMPKARAMGLNTRQAYAVLSEFMFTGASEDDVASMHLTTASFDDTEIEHLLTKQETVLARRRGLTVALPPGGLKKIAVGLAGAGLIALIATCQPWTQLSGLLGSRTPAPVQTPAPASTPRPTAAPPSATPQGPINPASGFLTFAFERPGDPADFLMRIQETTRAEYAEYLDDTAQFRHNPSTWSGGMKPPAGTEDLPVTDLRWEDAVAYCEWYPGHFGLPPGSVRLPTLAEFHRVARESLVDGLAIEDPIIRGRLRSRRAFLKPPRDDISDTFFMPEGRIYDLMANAGEWGWDQTDAGERLVFGINPRRPEGQADLFDPRYLDPATRSPLIGFRVVIVASPN